MGDRAGDVRAVAVVVVGVRVVVEEVVRIGERCPREVRRPFEVAEVLIGDAGVDDGDDHAFALRGVPGVVGGDQAKVPLVEPEGVVGDRRGVAVGDLLDGADDAAGGQRLADLAAAVIGDRNDRKAVDNHRPVKRGAVGGDDIGPAVFRHVVRELDGELAGRVLRVRVWDVDAALGAGAGPRDHKPGQGDAGDDDRTWQPEFVQSHSWALWTFSAATPPAADTLTERDCMR